MKKLTIRPGLQIVVADAGRSRLLAAKDQGKRLVFCNETDELAHTCRNCFGLGTLVFQACAAQERPEYIQCPCPLCHPEHETELASHFLKQSGLQANEYAWRTDHLAQFEGKTQAVAAAQRLVENTPHPVDWMTLYGDYGVGKSGLMKATVAALCQAGVSAIYRRADDILSEAKAVFSEDQEAQDASERAIKARYGRYQFLAIDEVDRIARTAWSTAFIFSILDERYNARGRQATMIATNAMPGQLGPDFGYLEDRMKDGQRIIIAGPSLRGKTGIDRSGANGTNAQRAGSF